MKEELIEVVDILAKMSDVFSDKELVKTLMEFGFSEEDSIKYVIFVPIVFCRLMLPNFNFPTYYFARDNKKENFSDNQFYMELYNQSKKLFDEGVSSETILSVSGRSSEFKTINKLLSNGSSLEEIELTPTYIV